MASRLWSKAENQRQSPYCDLFTNVSPELQKEFDNWDKQLKQFEWKHRFLNYRDKAIKYEGTAVRFGKVQPVHANSSKRF